jgi:hypothetical protein
MANAIKEVGGALVNLIVLTIFGFLLWTLWKQRGYFGLGGDGAGKAQSIKNAGAGFPSGGDPGSIPLFQDMQGAVESFRTLFSPSSDSDEYSPQQASEMTDLAYNYVPPSQAQLNQDVQNAENYFAQQDPLANLGSWAVENKLF